MQRIRSVVIAGVAVAALAAPPGAGADPVGCQRGIAKAASKYVQARAKTLQRCEDAKAKGSLRADADCLVDPGTAARLGAAATMLFAGINIACGGANRDCGDGDDEPIAATGWGTVAACPDFMSSGCTNAIATCTDIATCLACVGDAAVGQAMALYYGALASGEFATGNAVNLCQRAIGKATTRFLGARSKALQKCRDGRLKGTHANPCPTPGDGRAADAIARAEAKKVATICKACGGADLACGGSADLTPGQIGFVASCPPVTTLAPASCSGAVGDTQAIVACVDCVTAFDTDCLDAAAVPQLVGALPATCNPTGTTTTTTSSTTSSSTAAPTTSTSSTSTSTSLAVGTTTSSTSSTSTSSTPDTSTTSTSSTTTSTMGSGPTKFDFTTTLGSGNCGTTFRFLNATIPLKNLVCTNLSLGGGISQVPDNVTPAGGTNRFSLACTGSACTVGSVAAGGLPSGVDCTATGCNFGTPLPISNAGLSVCVANTFSSGATGTLDTGTGDVALTVPLSSKTILTATPLQPCPICRIGTTGGAPCAGTPASPCTGVCEGSPNQGAACVSRNPNGLTSDCPVPAADAGTMIQKCFRGSNNGATCAGPADCPSGVCAQHVGDIAVSLNPLTTGTATKSSATGTFCPGQTSLQKGAFKTDVCTAGANSGLPCITNADCPTSTCHSGTLNNYCNGGTNDGKGCTVNADCGTGGTCVKAGTLVQLIREVGAPGSGGFALNTAKAVKLAAVFCVPVTNNGTVNSNANLPGPGATSLAGTVTTMP